MGGAERLIALPFLFLRPVPLPQLPPTKVWREGKAERLSCCRLGPLLPPGMTRNQSTSSASSRLCPETQTTTPKPSQLHGSADAGGSGAAQTSARRRVPFTQAATKRPTPAPSPSSCRRCRAWAPSPALAAGSGLAACHGRAAWPRLPTRPQPRRETRLAPPHPASTHQGRPGGCSHLLSWAKLRGGGQQLPRGGGREGGGGRT